MLTSLIFGAFLDFFDVLAEFEIIQYALIAGIIVGVLAPLIGTVVVIRRLSFIADTLSHFSLAGVCLGVFLAKLTRGTALAAYISPLWLGIIFSVTGTFLIEKLRSFYKNYKELSMPIVLSLGVALSGIFIAASEGSASNLTNSLLFGSIYTVSRSDLIFILIFTVAVFTFIIIFYQKIILLCFDETYATLSGINIRAMQLTITIVLALFISIFMEIIGVLLISALMIIPVAASILIGDSFKNSTIISIIFSEVSILLGFIVSYDLQLPTGSVIVLFNIIILILVMLFRKIGKHVKKKRLKAQT